MTVNVNSETINYQVKAIRKANGCTLQELSQKVDISVSHLSDFERGASDITISKLLAILGHFGYQLTITSEDSGIDKFVLKSEYERGLSDAIKAIQNIKLVSR